MLDSAYSALKASVLALVGIFIDDASLALSLVLILVATAFAASTPWLDGTLVGGLFVAAVLVALLENVERSARHAAANDR